MGLIHTGLFSDFYFYFSRSRQEALLLRLMVNNVRDSFNTMLAVAVIDVLATET